MTTNEIASAKIKLATQSCAEIQAAWHEAATKINGGVSTNGYGIYHDRFELRDKLQAARNSLDKALAAIDKTQWPTDADYDQAEM